MTISPMNTAPQKRSLHSLHTASSEALRRALAALQPDDAILLREDAVLLARHELLANALLPARYTIQADIDARGLNSLLPGYIQPISEQAFVELTLLHDRVIAWS